MRRTTTTVLGLMLALLLAACGGTEEPGAAPDPGPTEPGPTEPGPTEPGPTQPGGTADTFTLTGTLGGDAELEGGCAWLESPDGRFEVMYPEGYTVTFDPLQLVGPDGAVVAEEGDEVTVSGSVAEDLASFCQVGQIFAAEEVL